MTTPETRFAAGTRVRLTSTFLRNTGQYTGPEAPTCVGPFARGEVVGPHPIQGILVIRWDDGEESGVRSCNLEICPMTTPDATAYIQRHPRYGHLELVLDIHTTFANQALGQGDRIITSHVSEALEDARQAGLTVHFPGGR